MKTAAWIGLALVLAAAGAALAQMWLALWPPQVFIKLMASDAILVGLAAAVAFFLHEQRETEKLNNDRTLP